MHTNVEWSENLMAQEPSLISKNSKMVSNVHYTYTVQLQNQDGRLLRITRIKGLICTILGVNPSTRKTCLHILV